MGKTFSVRAPLQGEIADFLRLSNVSCVYTEELVRDITCLLMSYREEDIPLFPEVFVIPSHEALLSIAPGTHRVIIGRNVEMKSAAEKILKDCATLAVRGWAIYVIKTSEQLAEFGLFRALTHSFAISAEETMATNQSDSPCILIRNRGRSVVELCNAKNQRLTVSFTSAPASESPFKSHVETFSSVVTAGIPEGQRGNFEQYLTRLLTEKLQHCHGTLLAAHQPPTGLLAPEPLNSGVWLTEPLCLYEAHRNARDSNDAPSLASLIATEALLEGMIASDGVVVFSTRGSVLGYRIFLKPTEAERKSMPDEGGGRRRTYALMKSRLGPDLRAAFFRSEDGQTDCERANK